MFQGGVLAPQAVHQRMGDLSVSLRLSLYHFTFQIQKYYFFFIIPIPDTIPGYGLSSEYFST